MMLLPHAITRQRAMIRAPFDAYAAAMSPSSPAAATATLAMPLLDTLPLPPRYCSPPCYALTMLPRLFIIFADSAMRDMLRAASVDERRRGVCAERSHGAQRARGASAEAVWQAVARDAYRGCARVEEAAPVLA